MKKIAKFLNKYKDSGLGIIELVSNDSKFNAIIVSLKKYVKDYVTKSDKSGALDEMNMNMKEYRENLVNDVMSHIERALSS